MSALAALQLAVRALWRNKMRALLTALGVIIGVAAVITMVAIGAGAQKRIASQLDSMGTNNLTIRSGSSAHGGVRTGVGTTHTLMLADAEALRELPGVVAVAPNVRSSVQARFRGTNWGTSVDGVTPEFFAVRDWPLAEGELFTAREVALAAPVCVIGQTVVKELFGLTPALGETILFKSLACRVVGVLVAKGASAFGSDQDDVIYAPLTTVQRNLLGITYINGIEVQAANRAAAFSIVPEIKKLIRQRHRLRDDQEDDFRIFNRAELAQTAETSAQVFSWLLGSIASVSLLVGGIGIMNIMLVSVTERTREIGIRMALGARRNDILWQFLLEALILSGAGGVIGILAGMGGAAALAKFSEFQVSVTMWSIIMAFGSALLVGVFFGLHPARKASHLRPIEALRYE
ncbi:MAG: ABC transporter permease [Gammaproteobacteria bacterium]|nr:ABC transporter permease [Gammaproteobacteria bacterium]